KYSKNTPHIACMTDVQYSNALPSIYLVVFTAFPCTLINVIVGEKFCQHLRQHNSISMQVLIFQAAVSQTFLLAVASFIIGQLGFIHSPILEYATHLIGDCCIVSSVSSTMYFVRPYR
ncbi:hypothetical protein PENTCL1PPCAC_16412, partial [Pristionchus entomophagus]